MALKNISNDIKFEILTKLIYLYDKNDLTPLVLS
jgi:hypothetical protein